MPFDVPGRKFMFLGARSHPGRCSRSRPVLALGRTQADNGTGRAGRWSPMFSRDPGGSALKTLAPERERAEIRKHPIGCLERRSSIQQAELESFQPRTPSSCGFGHRECPCSESERGLRRWTSCPRPLGQDPFRPEAVDGPSHRSDVGCVAAGREAGFFRSFS